MSVNFSNLTPHTWKRLNSEGDPASGYKGTFIVSSDNQKSNILIFIDDKNNYHMVIAEDALDDSDIKDPFVNGLTLKLTKYRFKNLGVQNFIDLECTNKAFIDEFTEIVKEVSEKILVENQPPAAVVTNVINGWKAFWSQRPKEILSDEQQIGLLCELKVFRSLAHTDPTYALDTWKGPFGEKYDFLLTDKVIEVKGTRSGKRIHKINGIDQLTAPDEKQLYIVSYLVSKCKNQSSLSLPELIDEIESTDLSSKASYIQKFRELLSFAGYSPIHREKYKQYRFDIYDGLVYQVNDDFPKLTINELSQPLSSRISNINYCIEFEGLPYKKIESISF